MKSSLHSLTPFFTIELPTLKPTLSVPQSIIISAGLGSSLYSLGEDPKENTVSNSSSVVACVFIAAGTCLLSSCLWLHCSGLQASCHSIFCGHHAASIIPMKIWYMYMFISVNTMAKIWTNSRSCSHWTVWSRGNVLHFYLGSAQLKSKPGSWSFMAFLSPSMQIMG
jgi:hypothetical protein